MQVFRLIVYIRLATQTTMLLQIFVGLLLLTYLTALAVAFHRLVFEIRLGFGRKAIWFGALIFFPIIGLLLFFSNLKPNTDVLSTKVKSLSVRLVKSFLYTVIIFMIVLLVFWAVANTATFLSFSHK